MAHIAQINLSNGGVPKHAVPQAQITSAGLLGDVQAHPKVHGGPQRAVCLYALEKVLALQEEGHPLFPGALGENITLRGLAWEQVTPGRILHLGGTVSLEITRYTTPCRTIAPYFRDAYILRVSQQHHPGWSRVYARVLRSGEIHIGDEARLEPA